MVNFLQCYKEIQDKWESQFAIRIAKNSLIVVKTLIFNFNIFKDFQEVFVHFKYFLHAITYQLASLKIENRPTPFLSQFTSSRRHYFL